MSKLHPTKAPKPAWYAAPLFSRNSFSPRLLLAWQCFYFMLYVIYTWLHNEPKVLNGVLVQPGGIEGIVTVLAGIVVTALGLGTYKSVALGDPIQQTSEITSATSSEIKGGGTSE